MISGLKLRVVKLGAAFLILSFLDSFLGLAGANENERALVRTGIPILVYHRFGSVLADSMTVTTQQFESHLAYLRASSYTVLPLRQVVDYHLGKRKSLPCRPLAMTVDDGHKSVYTDLFPLVKKYQIPVTLFLYPSAISKASYAMTWDQLREIKASGLFDIQGHTYWHPNFRDEKKRLSSADYEKFVVLQLRKSKEKLEKELGTEVDMLSWPFGIYDEDLMRKAAEVGYVSAFTLKRHHVRASDSVMALPRYLITHTDKGRAFERLLGGSPCS